MFEQNQPVVFLQQHRLCFLQRTRVIEFRPEGIRVSMEDFPDEKEILFPASHQPPKQKKALMAAPAMASMRGSEPGRRMVSGARLAMVA